MKAIIIYQDSISGDCHVDPIATFDDDQTDLMNNLLAQLREEAKSDSNISFEIGDYTPPKHNPQTLNDIRGDNKRTDRVLESIEVEKVSSYEASKNIGNEPLW